MPKTARQTIYQEVTDRIIVELENGRVPWVQPWDNSHGDLTLPKNASTARAYSGINILILWGATIKAGHVDQKWLTYKQAQALGGNVQKGERGTAICYADVFTPKKEAVRAAAAGEEPNAIPFLKRYTVFNISQCSDLPARLFDKAVAMPDCETIPIAEALIKKTGAEIRIGGNRACYIPSEDFIKVPPQPAFTEQINYYRTCFHELGHWTGHKSRLDRTMKTHFGSKTYAREELVAEMASAFTCANLGITPTVRHADYIGSWLEVLKDDNRAIFQAASKASKAADFILAFGATDQALKAA